MADEDEMIVDDGEENCTPTDKHILVQFKSEAGDALGSPFDMPASLSKEKLQRLCDALLNKVGHGLYHIYLLDYMLVCSTCCSCAMFNELSKKGTIKGYEHDQQLLIFRFVIIIIAEPTTTSAY